MRVRRTKEGFVNYQKTPVPSELKRAPRNFPLDFYNAAWFNQLQPDQKRSTTNCQEVASLPNAAQYLMPVRHPDEKLGDRAFSGKYLNIFLQAYNMCDEEDGGFDDGEDKSDSDTSIDLEADSDGGDDDKDELDVYSDGDYGDLYEEDHAEGSKAACETSESEDSSFRS